MLTEETRIQRPRTHLNAITVMIVVLRNIIEYKHMPLAYEDLSRRLLFSSMVGTHVISITNCMFWKLTNKCQKVSSDEKRNKHVSWLLPAYFYAEQEINISMLLFSHSASEMTWSLPERRKNMMLDQELSCNS